MLCVEFGSLDDDDCDMSTVVMIVVMGMKTLAIVKMRPLWKIASALFWHSVSVSVYKEQYTSDIQCIYTYTVDRV